MADRVLRHRRRVPDKYAFAASNLASEAKTKFVLSGKATSATSPSPGLVQGEAAAVVVDGQGLRAGAGKSVEFLGPNPVAVPIHPLARHSRWFSWPVLDLTETS